MSLDAVSPAPVREALAEGPGTSEAIEWASRCPGGENEVIEVRQVQEFSDFPADVQEAAAGFNEMHKAAGQPTGA